MPFARATPFPLAEFKVIRYRLLGVGSRSPKLYILYDLHRITKPGKEKKTLRPLEPLTETARDAAMGVARGLRRRPNRSPWQKSVAPRYGETGPDFRRRRRDNALSLGGVDDNEDGRGSP